MTSIAKSWIFPHPLIFTSMNLVIMAAGEGKRMLPLTSTTPKPLLKICGKAIIEHNIEPIIDCFDEIFFVVKYKSEKFHEYFWENYRGKKVHYIEQIDTPWTGAAILSLEGHIQWDFLVVSWDDLYEAEDIKKLLWVSGYAAIAKEVDKPENFGIFQINENNEVVALIEKPQDSLLGNLAYTWILKLHSDILPLLGTLPLSPRWELEITDLMDIYIKSRTFSVVKANWRWITIGYPWDLLKANDVIVWGYTDIVNKGWVIESNVTIKGNILIEEGVLIKSWTYIEWNVYFWKNSIIWPNAYIRGNTSIGEFSKVWSFVECKNSYIGDSTSIPHLSYIWDSIIWNHVNIGGWSKTANLRHDGKNIRATSKWELLDTWRKKLGVIIGDNAALGIDTSIYPGRVIPESGTTAPGEIVR